MNEVALNDVGSIFRDLIAGLRPGEEVGVLQDGERVATIRKEEHREARTTRAKLDRRKGRFSTWRMTLTRRSTISLVTCNELAS